MARIPQQKRGIATRNRILEAAKKLFAEKGFHHTNSKEIVAEAGVSIGAFYGYFPDKKALFIELLTEHRKAIYTAMDNGMRAEAPDKPGKVIVRNILDTLTQAHSLSPDFQREVTSMILSDPEVREHFQRTDIASQRSSLNLMLQLKPKLRVRDLESAAFVLGRAAEAILHAPFLYDLPVPNDRVLESFTDMITRFLFEDEDA